MSQGKTNAHAWKREPEAVPRGHKVSGSFLSLHTSPPLHIALHGMSSLINSRLPKTALDLCLELLEVGVNAQALADVVLKVLAVKENTQKK
ncbi:mitotic-spindle organizing protein 1 [Drosophila ananassae]|uniref:mitotic-spindle organizing protein 1 n=1 Tax=Drosophila ananassae TaxID=7217 RepID=UPI000177B8BB|nr:mitotic-spindle organizing protein 1 [Drosophila ananassae]